MPLFKPMLGTTKRGQLQVIFCPRCKLELEGTEVSTYGQGLGIRIVEGVYECSCSYKVTVREEYPVINKALDDERHI